MRQKVTAARLDEFMKALGSGVTEAARVYLVGGASSVLLGWRDSTIDVDLKLAPESDEILRRFSQIEDQLHRYPALDPESFRRAVESVVASSPDE